MVQDKVAKVSELWQINENSKDFPVLNILNAESISFLESHDNFLHYYHPF